VSGFIHLDGLQTVPPSLKGAVVAIGNFDGMHRGHQTIVQQALDKARELDRPAVILTFEPHPRDVFAPEPFMFRLTDATAKARLANALGLNGLVVMDFSRELAAIEAPDFVRMFLVEALAASAVVVGEDFHFGKGRRGTPAFLREEGERHGFEVVQLSLLESDNDTVSSSRIRAALNTGGLETANRLLGYHWIVQGTVVMGDRRGRELGYPTANFQLPSNALLAQGIYATRVRLKGRLFDGAASFGKPMFDIHQPPFEVHIFDFDEDIYGQELEVALISHIRGQMTFDGLEDLIAQMDADCTRARKTLNAAEPISKLDADLGFIIKG